MRFDFKQRILLKLIHKINCKLLIKIQFQFKKGGLYSQKIKTLKNFKIKSKENKISHGRGNSLRNKKKRITNTSFDVAFYTIYKSY